MGSRIVKLEFLLASVGCIESAGIYGVQVVVREKDERKEGCRFLEYLRSRERVLVGEVSEPRSAGSHSSIENAYRKPEDRVVDILRGRVVSPRIGL